MTDNEYKAVAVYRMLKNESSVTQTVTPGHRPVTSTLPVSASVVIHRDGAKVYQTQASSARSLSPWFKLAAETALSFRQVEEAWASCWQADAESFNLELQTVWNAQM